MGTAKETRLHHLQYKTKEELKL